METIIVFTHGRAKGDPGPAGVGVYVTKNGKMVQETKQAIGNSNNDFAGYYAVMLALQTLVEIYGQATKTTKFEIKISNELVQKQLNAKQQIKEPGLVPMFIEIHNLQVENFTNITFTLISSELNKEAGRLVKEVIGGK